MKVNPNPANSWVRVDYTLPEGFNKAVIYLSNSMELEVYTQDDFRIMDKKVILTILFESFRRRQRK